MIDINIKIALQLFVITLVFIFGIVIFNCKCTKDSIKIRVIKILLSYGMIIAILMAFRYGWVLLCKMNPDDDLYVELFSLMIIFIGLPPIILTQISNLDLRKIITYHLPFKSYRETKDFLQKELIEKGFEAYMEKEGLSVFIQKKKSKIYIYVDTFIQNITKNKLKEVYEEISNISESLLHNEKNNSKLLITLIISTTESKETFIEYIKNLSSNDYTFILPVGIDIDKGQLKVVDTINNFDLPKRKRMLKELKKVFKL